MRLNIERILLVINIIAVIIIGAFMGIQKGLKEPVTVYVDGCNETVPIENLNIAPLEVIEGK